ncbi:TolC family protein [Marinilongibacter aquaticus]|uniref:TolC family protein n=1 Tax=Marinilongibacter aquaticus TaxID=2975157 RepID=UPI0021BD9546|nr:TolC family protein [Marinilongibacter aquaticus]UBM60735.1 TolC family protein [Marinilongibacter aquaticus]
MSSLLQEEISNEYLEKLIGVAKKNYPIGKGYDARLLAADKKVKITKLSYFDVISFSYLLSPLNSTSTINPNRLNGYQFGLFINIGNLIKKPTEVKQAKDELEVIEAEKEMMNQSLEADVKRRYFAYVKAKAVYKVVTNALLDSKDVADQMKYRFEKGEVSFDEYNNVLLDMSNREQTKINAESEILIAKSSLEELLGTKLENIK